MMAGAGLCTEGLRGTRDFEASARGHSVSLVGGTALGTWAGFREALASGSGTDAKSPLISEEPQRSVTMAITLSSAQISNSLCRSLQRARFNVKEGRQGSSKVI